MNILKISSAVLLAFLLLGPIPSAKAGSPYGGLAIFTIPCTCSGNLWIYFSPLYLSSSIPISGALEYSPSITHLYEYYNIGTPGSWHLGDYTKSSACYIYDGDSCFLLPSSGLMTKAGIGLPL